MIDKDWLNKRLEGLSEQEFNALRTLHAVRGAIQECQYHLQQLEQFEQSNKND